MKNQEDFDDFKTDILDMINTGSSNSGLISQLNNFLKDIINLNSLKTPFQDETKDFIDDFSVSVITKILQMKEKSKSTVKLYQSVLSNYVKILANNITSDYIKFIEAGKLIITQKTQNFYYVSSMNFGVPSEVSPFFFENIREFVNQNVLEILINFYKKENSFDISKSMLILSIIYPLTKFFEKPKLKEYVSSLLNAYQRWIDVVDIETLKNNNVHTLDKFNNTLFVISSNCDLRSNYILINFSLNIRLIKTKLLQLQFNALSSMKNVLNKSYIQTQPITKFLKKEKFLDIFLNESDMHHQLVSDFSSIFGYMIKNNDANDEDIKKFWVLCISQHPSVIDYFFKPWYSLFYEFNHQLIEYFFKMIIEVNIFPNESIGFLKKIVFKASNNMKTKLFKCLYGKLKEENEKSKNINQNIIVSLLCILIPSDDENYCLKIQNKCMKLISKNQYINIALPLLKSSIFTISSQKAREYFDVVVQSMMENNVDVPLYFDLLIKIIDNFDKELSDKEFSNLKKLTNPLIDSKEHFNQVCQFFSNIMKLKFIYLTDEMLIELFEKISTVNYFNNDSFVFIKRIFEKINKKYTNQKTHSSTSSNNTSQTADKSQEKLYDLLWTVLLNNPSANILNEYIVSLYEKTPQEFIHKCFEYLWQYDIDSKNNESCNLQINGLLNLLEKYIHFIQDGFDLSEFGIHQNQFYNPENIAIINLKGNLERRLKVPKTISYRSLIQRIAWILEKDPQRIRLKYNDSFMSKSTFFIEDFITIEVTVSKVGYISYVESSKYKNPLVNVQDFPSMILVNEKKYSTYLMKILKKLNNRKALKILNLMPPLSSETDLFHNPEKKWNKIFEIKQKKFLFLYRLNLMGNLFNKNDAFWEEIFFNTDGITIFLDIAITEGLYAFSNSKDIQLVLKIINLIFDSYFDSDFKSNLIKTISSLSIKVIPLLFKYIIEKNNIIDDNIMLNLLQIFRHFVEYGTGIAEKTEDLINVSKILLFSSNEKIRKETYNIISLFSNDYIKQILQSLLPYTSNGRCTEFFKLMKPYAESSNNPELLFNDLFKILIKNYELPKEKGPPSPTFFINILLFKSPKQQFSNGLFSLINLLVSRIIKNSHENKKLKKRVIKLFKFLCDNVIFNYYKYYELSSDLVNIIVTIMNNIPKATSIIMPYIKQISEYSDLNDFDYFNESMKLNLVSNPHYRGLKNLGATCYMNATIQQLFNISEFRNKVLECRFDDTAWIKEFQYLFAELLFFPSNTIDPSSFVTKWTGWDGQIVNPREPEDAVEFLQMIIERLDEKYRGITSMFKGKVVHTLVGREIDFTNKSIEDFITLSLEVKNHKCIEESLNTFLAPDKFEGSNGYNVEGYGVINADMFHKIKESPEILIIQLKRFEYNLSSNTRVKVNSEYHFPLELDISSVMENNSYDENIANPYIYDLIGIVMHMGSAVAGHYFSHVKTEFGKWVTLNDLQISKSNEEKILIEAAGGHFNYQKSKEYGSLGQNIEKDMNGYLLFYRKRKVFQNNTSDFPNSSSAMNISGMISNEIEGQNERYSLFNIDKEQNLNGIQQIDKSCFDRLVYDIHQSIAQKIFISDEFSKLIIELCKSKIDYTFLYSHFVFCLKKAISLSKNSNTRLSDDELFKIPDLICYSCINILKDNNDFANHILSQTAHINEFLILSDIFRVRDLFSKLLCSALNAFQENMEKTKMQETKKIPKTKIAQEAKDNLSKISIFNEFMKNKMQEIIVEFSLFNEYFTVLQKLIEIISNDPNELNEWTNQIYEFLNISLPNYNKKNQSLKIYQKIDLTNVFKIINNVHNKIINNINEKMVNALNDKQKYEIISNNLLNWCLSFSHSRELILFIRNSITENKFLTELFLNNMNSKELSSTQLSMFFTVNLIIDDSFNSFRDSCFSKQISKQYSYTDFLESICIRVQDFNNNEGKDFMTIISKRFIKYVPFFSKYFFKSKSDTNFFSAYEKAIYLFFNKSTQNLINLIYEQLIENRSNLIESSKLPFSLSNSNLKTESINLKDESSSYLPVYFNLLKWTILKGNFNTAFLKYVPDFISILRRFRKNNNYIGYCNCFNTLLDIYCDDPLVMFKKNNSIDYTMLYKFIQSIQPDFIPITENLTRILLLFSYFEGDDISFIKTDIFKAICMTRLSEPSISSSFRTFIIKKLEMIYNSKKLSEKSESNLTKICSIIWDKQIFQKNISTINMEYVRLSCDILTKYQQTSNIFYDNSCCEFLCKRIFEDMKKMKKDNKLRAKSKLLATFNMSYSFGNKDKKSFIKGHKIENLVKLFTKYISIGKTLNSCLFTEYSSVYTLDKNSSKEKSLMNLNQNESKIWKSGLFDLLISLLNLDQFCESSSMKNFYLEKISSHVLTMNCSILSNCQADSQFACAKFINLLVNNMIKNKVKNSEDIISKEFLSLSNLNEKILTTKGLNYINESILTKNSRFFKHKTVEEICKQLQTMISHMKTDNISKLIKSFNNLFSKTHNPKMFANSIKEVSMNLPQEISSSEDIKNKTGDISYFKCDREAWCKKAIEIISIEISNTLKDKDTVNLTNISIDVGNCLDFIIMNKEKFSIQPPKFQISKKRISSFVVKLKDSHSESALDTASKIEKYIDMI